MNGHKSLSGLETFDDDEMENQLMGVADQLSKLKAIVDTEQLNKGKSAEKEEESKETEEYMELKNTNIEKLEKENCRLEREIRMLTIELHDQKNINNALIQSQTTDLDNLEKEIEALKTLLETKIEVIGDLNKQLESTKSVNEQQLNDLRQENIKQIKANKLIQEKNNCLAKENEDIQHLKHMVDHLKQEKESLSKEMEQVKFERDENKLTVVSSALDTVQLRQMNDRLTSELKIERDHARKVPSIMEDMDAISRQIAYINTLIQRKDDWVMIDPTRKCCMCKKPMADAITSSVSSCCLCQLLQHIVELKTYESCETAPVQYTPNNKLNTIKTNTIAALMGIIFVLLFIVISK